MKSTTNTNKIVNLNFNLKDLNGKDVADANVGKIVANTLVGANKGDAIKFYDWAMKLHSGVDLDLDRADFDTLKNFIDKNENLSILLKAQALEKLV